MTNTIIPTRKQKQDAEKAFAEYFEANKKRFNVASWTKYKFGYSHDGIFLYNDSSNSFSMEEINLISVYCTRNCYSFSVYARRNGHSSGYGCVAMEINIAQ